MKNRLKNIILEEYQKIKQQLNEQTYTSPGGKVVTTQQLKDKYQTYSKKNTVSFDEYVQLLVDAGKIKKKSSSSSNSNNSEYEIISDISNGSLTEINYLNEITSLIKSII